VNDEDLIRELGAAARRSDDAPTGTDLDAPLGAEFEAKVATRIVASQRAKRPRRAWLAVAAPLAMAAAVALWIARPHATGSPLPDYAMEVTGGEDAVRGESHAPQTTVVARADGSLTLLLRPASDVHGALDVRAFAASDGAIREVPVTTRISESGSIEMHGRVADLTGASGGAVIVVVSRAGSGVDARAVAAGNEAAPADVKVAKIDVRVAR
jgi:hypothetical protein